MSGSVLNRQPTFQLTPEQFEKLYLQPGDRAAKGDLTKRLGNPTPIGLVAFLLCFSPTTWMFMNFQNSGPGSLTILVSSYYFIAGMLEIIAGTMEWVLGNTFPSTVFFAFGGFYLGFAYLLDPSKQATSAFVTSTYTNGAENPLYNSGIGLYLISWTVITFIFLIASLRTNAVFVMLFFSLDIGFGILATAYFRLAEGLAEQGLHLIKIAGGFFFVTCFCGYILFFGVMMQVVGMPFSVPFGDLSGFLKGKRDGAH